MLETAAGGVHEFDPAVKDKTQSEPAVDAVTPEVEVTIEMQEPVPRVAALAVPTN
jgi:hypothetical protein